MTIWRALWPTAADPHLFWGVTRGVPWVVHYSPTAGPGLYYTLVLDGAKGWPLYTFDQRPLADDVEAAVESWFRTAAPDHSCDRAHLAPLFTYES